MPQGVIRYLKFDIDDDAESRVFAFIFANLLQSGDTIMGFEIEQSNTTNGIALTLSNEAIVGSQVQVRITGGTVNTLYSLSCTATTVDGDTLVASGGLQTIGSQ